MCAPRCAGQIPAHTFTRWDGSPTVERNCLFKVENCNVYSVDRSVYNQQENFKYRCVQILAGENVEYFVQE